MSNKRYKTAKEYRDELTPEDIKRILRKFDVEPYREYADKIIYPTVNHNLEGGSPKLYYYKRNKMFKVYTGKANLFDIFQLIIDMHNLRGKEITLQEAIRFCDLEVEGPIEDNQYYGVRKQLDYLYKINENGEEEEPEEMVIYPDSVLDRYLFDTEGLKSWIYEDIDVRTLVKYNIKFDPITNAIVIPYYTEEGDLVGVRGRFLDPDAKAKYMPIRYQGQYLVHPTSQVLYGLNINEEAILESKTVIVFEGEKSVMKMDTIYRDKNIAVATSGRAITKGHFDLLKKYEVQNIIIAFDRDYLSIKELEKEVEEMKQKLGFMTNIFNISMIVDYDFILEHKNSPIDQGKKIFDELMQKRIVL